MWREVHYKETHFNPETQEFEDVCDWTIVPGGLRHDKLLVRKQVGKDIIGWRVYKVIDDDSCIYKLSKTRILAMNKADGLVSFIEDCIENNFMLTLVEKILNYAWDEMRFEYL